MPILLALGSAMVWGIGDYFGGRVSRFHPAVIVTFLGQAVSLVLLAVAVWAMGTPIPDASTLLWGGTAGVVGCLALTGLYYAFARGAMTVVAPVSAVVGAVVPVVVGLATGERPRAIAYAGIAVAIVAVALVSGALGERHQPTPRRILFISALAGSGFGFFFVALDRTAHDSGFWPLLSSRVTSVPLLLAIVVFTGARAGKERSLLVLAAAGGVLDVTANALYLAATRNGLLSIVAVVGSMYPASTVLLAFAVDRERVNRWQAFGMVLAGVALVLVTLGRQ